jgi:hypothetical protein
MLAYIFWHRPSPQIEQKAYEDAIVRFQSDLAGNPPPGFIGAWSHRIDPVPWLGGQPGYEDWSLLEGSWAIDPLNGFAITGPRQPSHDHVAALSADGAGGLYAHAGGEILQTPQSTVYWLTRPRGIRWQTAIAPVRERCREAVIWRRQMLLGPATEFAVEVPGDLEIEVPSGWQLACRVRRARLPGQPVDADA